MTTLSGTDVARGSDFVHHWLNNSTSVKITKSLVLSCTVGDNTLYT